MNALLAIFASVAGGSILLLAVCVMHHIDLRHGRLFTATKWVMAAAAGAWLGLAPFIGPETPGAVVTVVASALSAIGWCNVQALIEHACKPGHVYGNWPAGLAFAAAASAATVAPSLVDKPKAEVPMRPSEPQRAAVKAAEVH